MKTLKSENILDPAPSLPLSLSLSHLTLSAMPSLKPNSHCNAILISHSTRLPFPPFFPPSSPTNATITVEQSWGKNRIAKSIATQAKTSCHEPSTSRKITISIPRGLTPLLPLSYHLLRKRAWPLSRSFRKITTTTSIADSPERKTQKRTRKRKCEGNNKKRADSWYETTAKKQRAEIHKEKKTRKLPPAGTGAGQSSKAYPWPLITLIHQSCKPWLLPLQPVTKLSRLNLITPSRTTHGHRNPSRLPSARDA